MVLEVGYGGLTYMPIAGIGIENADEPLKVA